MSISKQGDDPTNKTSGAGEAVDSVDTTSNVLGEAVMEVVHTANTEGWNDGQDSANPVESSMGSVEFYSAPRWKVQMGEIDEVSLDFVTNSRDDGTVWATLKLFGDGSPFVFDQDIDINPDNTYELVVSPELDSPMLLTSEAINDLVDRYVQAGGDSSDYTAATVQGLKSGVVAPSYTLTNEDAVNLAAAIRSGSGDLTDHVRSREVA